MVSYRELKNNVREDDLKSVLEDAIRTQEPYFNAEPDHSISDLEKIAKNKLGVYWESTIVEIYNQKYR